MCPARQRRAPFFQSPGLEMKLLGHEIAEGDEKRWSRAGERDTSDILPTLTPIG